MENKLTEEEFNKSYVTKSDYVNGCCATGIQRYEKDLYFSHTKTDGFMIKKVDNTSTTLLYTTKSLQEYSVLKENKSYQEVAPNFFRYIKTQQGKIHYSEMGYEALKEGEWLVDVDMKNLVKSFLDKLELEYELSEGVYESEFTSVYAVENSRDLYLYKHVGNGNRIIFRVKNIPFSYYYSELFGSYPISKWMKYPKLKNWLIENRIMVE